MKYLIETELEGKRSFKALLESTCMIEPSNMISQIRLKENETIRMSHLEGFMLIIRSYGKDSDGRLVLQAMDQVEKVDVMDHDTIRALCYLTILNPPK